MAFNRIEKSAFKGGATRPHRVTFAKSAKNNQLQITISKDVHAKLGSPAFLAAAVGTGTDKGTILLTPVATAKVGYRISQQNSAGSNSAYKLSIGATQLGIDWTMRTEDAAFDLTGAGLVVWLPKRPVAGNGLHAEDSAQASQWPSMQQLATPHNV
jgi:hypothetical protein